MSKCTDDSKCPEGKICNPKTGRCVSKTGKIGKQTTSPSPPSPRAPSPPPSPRAPSPRAPSPPPSPKAPALKTYKSAPKASTKLYSDCVRTYDTLTPNERKILGKYQGTDYIEINKFLWDLNGDFSEKELSKNQTALNLINLIKTKGVVATQDFVVYRNFDYCNSLRSTATVKAYIELMKEKLPDEYIDFYGLVSTSSKRTGREDPKEQCSVISATIIIPEGVKFICPEKSYENEIILLPGRLTKTSLNDKIFGLGVWVYTPYFI